MTHGKGKTSLRGAMVAALCCALLPASVLAQAATLPGPADIGRIRPEERLPVPSRSTDQEVAVPQGGPTPLIPEGAKLVHFTLDGVTIHGATVFTAEQLSETYAPYIHKDITLDKAWLIAAAITEKYRAAGFFLSRAYVPEQKLEKKGTLTINVVEGFVGQVQLDDALAKERVVRESIEELKAQKPMSVEGLESFLLRMNDLPDANFRAILAPDDSPNHEEGAVKLTLIAEKKNPFGNISTDNYGSRFLGPHEAALTYTASLLPLQQTSVSFLSSLPSQELRYGTIQHSIIIAPELTMTLTGGVTRAQPGDNLKDLDINSDSKSLELAFSWQAVRQREENLSVTVGLKGRNTANDIAGSPLTRDHIRAVRASIDVDRTDSWGGYNVGSVTLSQGIDGLGASASNESFLSRAEADPDFTKLELSATRLQRLNDDFALVGAVSGQLASGPLYSSEEFGYGGQSFGRAYDSSEIVGDRGVSGSLEVRYYASAPSDDVRFMPYSFFDIGKAWNFDAGQVPEQSGSSAGAGVRVETLYDISANLGVAFPLTKPATNPIYDGSGRAPRFLMQISKNF